MNDNKPTSYDALRFVNETYFALIPAIGQLRERGGPRATPPAIGELIAIVSAWADYRAFGAVWIGGELVPCINVIEAITKRLCVTEDALK
jgi:hypothetical protein